MSVTRSAHSSPFCVSTCVAGFAIVFASCQVDQMEFPRVHNRSTRCHLSRDMSADRSEESESDLDEERIAVWISESSYLLHDGFEDEDGVGAAGGWVELCGRNRPIGTA